MDLKMISSNAVYCIGLALMLVGGVLLCTLASSLVPAYNYGRDMDRVTCRVTTSQFVGNVCCEASVKEMDDCTKDYKYPCLKVNVTIEGDEDEDVQLYDEFHSAYYGGRIDDCSYFHCETGSYKSHMKRAKEFKRENKVGKKRDCYYHKSARKHVALSQIVTSQSITHSLVWSLLILIGGLVTCVVMLIVDWRNRKSEQNYENMKEIEANENGSVEHIGEDDDDSDIETIHVDGGDKKKKVDSKPTRNGIGSGASQNKLLNNSTPVKKV